MPYTDAYKSGLPVYGPAAVSKQATSRWADPVFKEKMREAHRARWAKRKAALVDTSVGG